MTIASHLRVLNERLSNLERCTELAPDGTYDRAKAGAAAIGEASQGILDAFRRYGFHCPGDDRLRNIEATLYGLMVDANPHECGLATGEGFGEHVGKVPGRDLVAEAARDRDTVRTLLRRW